MSCGHYCKDVAKAFGAIFNHVHSNQDAVRDCSGLDHVAKVRPFLVPQFAGNGFFVMFILGTTRSYAGCFVLVMFASANFSPLLLWDPILASLELGSVRHQTLARMASTGPCKSGISFLPLAIWKNWRLALTVVLCGRRPRLLFLPPKVLRLLLGRLGHPKSVLRHPGRDNFKALLQ